jgi:type II secretory pathway pseudopilin PulG
MLNKKNYRVRGFALISTILLMALLAVIAVGFLSLSAVTLRSSQHDTAMSQARANARTALMIAIGELQKEQGPDKRINAPASQMTGAQQPVAGRNHWVGVYDSWDSTSTANVLRPPAPNFRRWLVSGSPDVTKNIEAPKNASTADVVLWQGVDPSGVDRVSAPLVDISPSGHSSHAGAYAWWVGDENSKALVKRQADPAAADLAKAMSGVQAPETVAFHKHPVFVLPDKKLARNDAKLDKIASYETIDLLGLDPAAAAKSFHDLTPYSMGVHTDVARGGLKRDLSLYLDHPINQPLAVKLPNERRLYPGGITWEELWLFHNVWRALEAPHPSLQSKTGGNLANTRILMTKPGLGPASIDAFESDPFALYKAPIWIRMQYLNSVWTERNATDPNLFDLYIVTDGVATFWNPYDVPIALHPDAYMSLKIFGLPYRFRLLNSSGTELATMHYRSAVHSTDTNSHQMSFLLGTAPESSILYKNNLRGTPDPIVLMPGEVLIVSPGLTSVTPEKDTFQGMRISRSYRVRAGWNHARGNCVRMTSLAEPTQPLRMQVTPNDQFQLSKYSLINSTMSYGADNVGIKAHEPWRTELGGRSFQTLLTQTANASSSYYSNIFPTTNTTLPSLAAMSGPGGKHPVMLLSHQMKTEENPTASLRMHRPANNRNSIVNINQSSPASLHRILALSPSEIKVDGLNGYLDSKMIQLSTNQINRGLFGGSYTDHSRGQDTVVAVSVPREPPLSLGAFQHAIASGVTRRYTPIDPVNAALSPENGSTPNFHRMISNSHAFPVIAPNETQSTSYRDHSYHVNRMLWDSWFLSTIAQAQAPHHSNKLTAREVYEYFISETAPIPLPNGRMKSWKGYGENTVEDVFDRSEGPHELASAKMMIEGAFNVNSTSVEAWKALFSSLENAFVPVSRGTNSPGTVTPHKTELVTVPSLLTPYGNDTAQLDKASFESAATATAEEPAQWRGNRKLNPTEIKDLAEAMVEEVKSRGPFLSMADFVNRRPSTDRPLALRGPLQAALDKTVNKQIFDAANRVGTAPANVNYEFPEAAQLPKSMTTPGHVLQADMLTAIGPQLTVRSDTFRIRAYGEAHDKNGRVTAKAWCEAVVQRVPAYVDAIDPPYAADAPVPDPEPRLVPPLGSQANKQFGRRIDLISFRWLHESEVSN